MESKESWEADCLYWWGRVLDGEDCHWCRDWDDLPIDNTCEEYQNCTCIDDIGKSQ